jgi:hypothetical protein
MPLGAALENGWRSNGFGGPAFIASPEAFDAIASCTGDGFAPWTIYAAVAAHHRLAIVPELLYQVAAVPPATADTVARLADIYDAGGGHSIDLGWMLKTMLPSFAGAADGTSDGLHAGRSLYDRLLAIPDAELRGYTGLDPLAGCNPTLASLAAVRERLASLVERWRADEARVLIYGAGQHTRLLLAMCPSLGRAVTGFLDRGRSRDFLGRPCLHPDAFVDGMADVIVYSSREFERDMYARMRAADVEHVLLYSSTDAN